MSSSNNDIRVRSLSTYRVRALAVKVVFHIIAYTLGAIWLIPFLGLVMTSVRPFSEVANLGWWNLSEFSPSFGNYLNAWFHSSYPIMRGMYNSLIVALPATAIPIVLGSAAAYAFARFRFPFKNAVFTLTVVLMALPAQMIAIPLFQAMDVTGLLDTFVSVIVVHTAWGMPWIMFFMRNFFDQLPKNIEESAMLQGASQLTILLRIVVPISVAALISAAVLQFLWVWSDFFFPLIFLFSSEKLVAVQRLPLLKGTHLVDWGLLSAGTIIVVSVPILIFAFLQRYYVRGMIGWTLR